MPRKERVVVSRRRSKGKGAIRGFSSRLCFITFKVGCFECKEAQISKRNTSKQLGKNCNKCCLEKRTCSQHKVRHYKRLASGKHIAYLQHFCDNFGVSTLGRKKLFGCLKYASIYHESCPDEMNILEDATEYFSFCKHNKDMKCQHLVEEHVSDMKSLFQDLPAADDLDFEIPKSLHDVARKLNMRPPFVNIRRNINLIKRSKKRHEDDECMQCSCQSISGQKTCGKDCLCWILQTSCSSLCGCGGLCQNLPFQKRIGRKLQLVKTDKRGWGVVAAEDIKAGDFVIEYVGEVIDDKECENRLWAMKGSGETNFYMCEINREMVIDATFRGNISRYINHSCCPNCQLQKWQIDGELRVGIFAISDIKKGEEVAYDYQFKQFGMDQKCHCGTQFCRGNLGAKPHSKQRQYMDAAYNFVTKELEKISKKTKHCNDIIQGHSVIKIGQYVHEKKRHGVLGNIRGFLKDQNVVRCIGCRVQVWWPDDKKFYRGTIVDYDPFTLRHKISYDDGEFENLLMNEEIWELDELVPVEKPQLDTKMKPTSLLHKRLHSLPAGS